jgi:hypothetical protein
MFVHHEVDPSYLYIFITFIKGPRPVNSIRRAMVDVMDQSEDPAIIARYTTSVNTAFARQQTSRALRTIAHVQESKTALALQGTLARRFPIGFSSSHALTVT